ncbi:hypothetical protein FHG55_03155 [Pseudomonas jessenii]|uniref:Uncharacterized protein n=1 Tax=Pseudomonas jessenii TaxID=77298 RepID=A0A5C4L4U4_PSEJE|nr:hypothetical protein FHG55_03155 [Pseudomonas jessenii]
MGPDGLTPRPCGSGLARECNPSVDISGTGTPLSRASPLPQGHEGSVRQLQAIARPLPAPTTSGDWGLMD